MIFSFSRLTISRQSPESRKPAEPVQSTCATPTSTATPSHRRPQRVTGWRGRLAATAHGQDHSTGWLFNGGVDCKNRYTVNTSYAYNVVGTR